MMRLKVKDFYNGIADKYDEIYSGKEFIAEDLVVRDLILHGLTKPVLDIGCGTGLMIGLLGLKPDQYIGVDISMEMLRRAKVKFPDFYLFNGSIVDFDGLHLQDSGSVISTYGSISYLDDKEIEVTMQVADKADFYFFMYYADDYIPINYRKGRENAFSAVRFDDRRHLFGRSKFYRFNKYIVITNKNYEQLKAI